MIVVGVNQSDEAKHALAWALEEARVRRTGLRAVYAWVRPIAVGWSSIPRELLEPDALQTAAHDLVAGAVEEVAGKAAAVDIEFSAVEGAPSEVLVEAANDAELLVVGSRGLGRVGGILLNSVGVHVAQHASCPVVIVRQ